MYARHGYRFASIDSFFVQLCSLPRPRRSSSVHSALAKQAHQPLRAFSNTNLAFILFDVTSHIILLLSTTAARLLMRRPLPSARPSLVRSVRMTSSRSVHSGSGHSRCVSPFHISVCLARIHSFTLVVNNCINHASLFAPRLSQNKRLRLVEGRAAVALFL